jgi:aerobic-type carbon monoxide dehydrogenase small subunit (CoxS/CutS family)
MSENTKKGISRRQFLKDAGIVVGGTAVSSAFFLSACGKEVEVTKTVTTTAPGTTVTTTAPGTTSTVTTTAGDTTQTITKYTCPIDGQEFDSLEELKAHFDAEHEASESSADSQTISFTLNGKPYTKVVDTSWDLQYFLHDILGCYDIKTFCYRGACGSCTVIMDGRPILSCMSLAVDADGTNIETAQGIALANHPLLEPYIKHECMQCGYCTPGFVATAKALLDRNPDPTDHDIIEALAGNICRCGTYPQHVTAIKEAAAAMKEGGE